MKTRSILLSLWLFGSTALSAQPGNTLSPSPEQFRPQIHFYPESGWMSDPNGLVYLDGEYHLCYQHIPFDENGNLPWGEMYWGHAVSRDLLNWQHMPIALSPDSLGYIFSGCCVADLHNTSGLGSPGQTPLLAIFTYYDPVAAAQGRIETQSQGMAYSLDKGRSWIKYDKNPILPNPGIADFRDPHVFWHEPTQRWIMIVTAGKEVQLYASENCLQWSYLSAFGSDRGSHIGPWECPDLFPLRVQGSGETKWVLLASVVNFTDSPDKLATATQYFIGDFDGTKFTSDQRDTLWIDYGKDNYAGITFDNAPNGRRIFVGWMHSHQYAAAAQSYTTRSWSGAATFPREMSIVRRNGAYRLTSLPVKEIAELYGQQVKLKKIRTDKTLTLSEKIPFDKAPIEMNLQFGDTETPDAAARFGIRLKSPSGEYVSMEYDKSSGTMVVDRSHATYVQFSEPFSSIQRVPYRPIKGRSTWKILIDAASMELFVDDGVLVFTNVFFPGQPFNTIELYTDGGYITVEKGKIIQLNSIECRPVSSTGNK